MSIVPNWILFHECVDSRNACNHSSGSRLACYHSIDDRTHTYGIIVVTNTRASKMFRGARVFTYNWIRLNMLIFVRLWRIRDDRRSK